MYYVGIVPIVEGDFKKMELPMGDWIAEINIGRVTAAFRFANPEMLRLALRAASLAADYGGALSALGLCADPYRSLATTGSGSFGDVLVAGDVFFLLAKPVNEKNLVCRDCTENGVVRYGTLADKDKKWSALTVLPLLTLDAEGQFENLFRGMGMVGV